MLLGFVGEWTRAFNTSYRVMSLLDMKEKTMDFQVLIIGVSKANSGVYVQLVLILGKNLYGSLLC